jgi:hypothetical protein
MDAEPEPETLLGICHFSVQALSFQGSPVDQARCLLRHVGPRGVISPYPARLPRVLAARVGRPVEINAGVLERYLGPGRLGMPGRLSDPASRANDNDPSAPLARYFVIHDTSSLYLGSKPFPPDLDTSPEINDVTPFLGPNAVAHAFVKRTGEIVWGHDFAVPWRATQFESRVVKLPAKGLFLNIENVEPRRADPTGPPGNDWIAPRHGFTKAEYDSLTLLYIVASRRAGIWMIPTFHAILDAGLYDAHEDPQNFEMKAFGAALVRHLKAIARLQNAPLPSSRPSVARGTQGTRTDPATANPGAATGHLGPASPLRSVREDEEE